MEISAIVASERGDDEARVGFALRQFGPGDGAALAAQAFARYPGKVLEPAGRIAGCLAILGRFGKLGRNPTSAASFRAKPTTARPSTPANPKNLLCSLSASELTFETAYVVFKKTFADSQPRCPQYV